MKKINKIVLLSDEQTSKTGRNFLKDMQKLMEDMHLQVWHLALNLEEQIADAVYQFDRIALEIQPDLLIVADYACIKMQSPEEEPFYNNMTIPVIHLLFRRPWEYDVFMIWRSNFINRHYTIIPEDAEYIREFYPRVPNVKTFLPNLWNQAERMVCYSGQYTKLQIKQCYQNLPAYMKTIAERWRMIMERESYQTDTEAVKQCLKEIGFVYSAAEYQDILYMLQSAFVLHYYERYGEAEAGKIQIHKEIMQEQIEEFLNLDFRISLL